jgi:aminoglycoside phosphotransferase (APT) family kinase protein
MIDPASPLLDQPRDVRPGEALDEARLHAFLVARRPELSGPLAVQQFPSGHSNLTYLLRVGEHELVLRRPPFGAAIKTAHDMGREFHILSGLADVYPKVPRPILFCEDESVIGAPFYLMERVRGVILRGQRPPRGITLSPEVMRKLSTALIENLAQLHAVDAAQAGLSDLGHPQGYVARQIKGWTERYLRAKTDAIPQVEEVAAWLEKHRPPERGVSLIHGDFKYDNCVLDPEDLSRIVAVLDWEMATIGDPLMDLGTTLGYWVDPTDPDEHKLLPLGPTLLEGNLDRSALVAEYCRLSGRAVPDPLFYYVYGLFKIIRSLPSRSTSASPTDTARTRVSRR